jgi:uncharacterized phiE125 gp8 family phage protein
VAFLLESGAQTWGGFYGLPSDRFRPLLRVLTPPTVLAVRVSDAKEHLRLGASNNEDQKISRLIKAATGKLSSYTRRALVPASYAVDLWGFPFYHEGRIDLPIAPVRAVTAIRTANSDGTFTAVNPLVYALKIGYNGRAFVQLSPGQVWPSVSWGLGNATIELDAGYLAGECPAELQQAILLIVGALYENSSEMSATPMTRLPDAVESLTGNYRVLSL